MPDKVDEENVIHKGEFGVRQYSLAQLKRDAKAGVISAVMTVRAGERVSQEDLPERLRGPRKIVASNTTSITFENVSEPDRPSYLWLPKASLVEYTDSYLRIYSPGYREPTKGEQLVLDRWGEIEKTEDYQRRLEADVLTDGSSTYYQKVAFFRGYDMEYLMGYQRQRGMCLDFNRLNAGAKAFIQDETVRGAVSLEYKIERVKSLEQGSLEEKIQAAAEQMQGGQDKSVEKAEPVR